MTTTVADETTAPQETFAARVLAELVRIPSVNPGIYEAAVAARVAAYFDGTPATVDFVETFPDRPSVAVTLQGTGGGPRLVLNGHLDTVPVDDRSLWTVDPFGAEVRDGYLYGRGACDMKAGLAVQIAVAHTLMSRSERLRGDLVLHFAVGEECGEPGTLSLLKAGHAGDVGIVTEPTQLEVSVATRGLVTMHIRIHGRSIHASRAEKGINPVAKLDRVLSAVGGYRVKVREAHHDLLGSGSCTPTVVHGGVKPNAVADYCDLFLDRRLLPGETPQGELERLTGFLEACRNDDPDFSYTLDHLPYPFEPAEIPLDSPIARRLQETAGRVLGAQPKIVGTPFSCDVRNLVNDAGMDAVTYGPGNVAECHCVDERVSLGQLNDAVSVLTTLSREILTAS
ncbi:M20 family metallopeptidase [Streptomyces aureus]|uniref:M20 family metallopeptidase n=1 Tax=Streptomyces aureus TaxID=193461 RepID=A0ABV4SM36_9ACTN